MKAANKDTNQKKDSDINQDTKQTKRKQVKGQCQKFQNWLDKLD